MAKDNIILTKTYNFSLEITKLYVELKDTKSEYVLSKQLLRSATSIGANSEEAVGGSSKKDFIAKFQIAYKEARETKYWLQLLRDSNFIDNDKSQVLLNDTDEILRILSSILSTSKN